MAIEGLNDVPFAIQRVYYILGSTGSSRGFHAHRELEQLLTCPVGSCRVTLDDGHRRRDFQLQGPDQGLYIGPMIWREMHDFSEGSLLIVFASAWHNEDDYIRDYNEFRKLARDGHGH